MNGPRGDGRSSASTRRRRRILDCSYAFFTANRWNVFAFPLPRAFFWLLGGDQGVFLVAAVGCDKETDVLPVEIGCSVKGDVGRLIPSGSVLGC